MIILIGTGHVFNLSQQLLEIFNEKQPEIICVELDKQRYNALLAKRADPEAYKNYETALDQHEFFEIDNKLAEKFERIATLYEYEEKYKKAITILENIHDRNYVYFNGEDLQWRIRHIERVTAKIEERNRIIRDQAHNIKNILRSVINPLEILQRKTGMINNKANKSLEKKVEKVDSHISFSLWSASDSSET